MLQWYRGQVKQHGAIDATRLFWRVGWAKVNADLANKILRAALDDAKFFTLQIFKNLHLAL